MSIDHAAFFAWGWMLDDDQFEQNGLNNIDDYEELMDEGYLHYVDQYEDKYPYFLGEGQAWVTEGSAYCLTDLGIVKDACAELKEIAKEKFNIDVERCPAKPYLISQVY